MLLKTDIVLVILSICNKRCIIVIVQFQDDTYYWKNCILIFCTEIYTKLQELKHFQIIIKLKSFYDN